MEGYISDLSLTESDALNIWEQNKCFPVKHILSLSFFFVSTRVYTRVSQC